MAAHELGHAVHVQHHGPSAFDLRKIVTAKGKVYPYGGENEPTGSFEVRGGQNSGDDNCVMRYSGGTVVEDVRGPLLATYLDDSGALRTAHAAAIESKLDPKGKAFCTTKAGLGVNDAKRPGGSKFGDASLGNCMAQVCVNWHTHAPSRAPPPAKKAK